jgi:multisubunit Na+/H+ antiporter MnhE subunit
MHPSKQKNTCIIEYRTKLESPNALTLLANSITLTPGTLVVDYREKDQMMLIHCLNLRDRQQTFKDVRKWEKLLQKIFGEKT